jgi:DNA gyrase/topoisomerase IV subunit A
VVNARTGIDAVTLALLETLDDLDAGPTSTFRKSSQVLDALFASRGIAPRHGYDAAVTACAHWLTHVRVVDFHGNHGSADPNDGPANPRYTEMRLSHAGALALASERGEIAPVPIGVINGDLAAGGSSPAFDPVGVVDAVRAAGNGSLSDEDLVVLVGAPSFPTQCTVQVDGDALALGEATTLRMSAHISVERDQLVLSRLPYGESAEAVTDSIARRVDAARHVYRERELREQLDLSIIDVVNESVDPVTRIVCQLQHDADPLDCARRLLETWPVSTELPVRLRAPLPRLVRHLADGTRAQDAALTALLDAIR